MRDHLNRKINQPMELISGKSLCPTCYKAIFVCADVDNTEPGSAQEYVPAESSLKEVDEVCSILGMSPVSKLKRLSAEKQKGALRKKCKRITNTLQRNLEQSFSESVIVDGRQNCANPLCKEYDVLIEKLKIKAASEHVHLFPFLQEVRPS